jgi:hypothetical protein
MPDLNPNEVALLAAALTRDYPAAQTSVDRAWSRAPALRVVDCVLSLNRRYDGFVVPRLDRFERAHPRVISVRHLRSLIDTYNSPAEFMRAALDYRDEARAVTLSGVVDFVVGILDQVSLEGEMKRLEAWARIAVPDHYRHLGISGFGLAGFQYRRMLFGANTTKPDVHILGYIKEVVGRKVSDIEGLRLLESAAACAEITIRNADTNIWERRARSVKRAPVSTLAALPATPAIAARKVPAHPSVSSQAETNMSNAKTLIGRVRDTQAKGKTRNWEVIFDRAAYGADFPQKHESPIEVEWPSGTFRCLVGIKPSNPIYLRQPAARVDGIGGTRMTDLCVKHGLGRDGPIQFEVVVPKQRYRVVL